MEVGRGEGGLSGSKVLLFLFQQVSLGGGNRRQKGVLGDELGSESWPGKIVTIFDRGNEVRFGGATGCSIEIGG